MARISAILLLLFFVSGCSDPKTGAPAVDEAHPPGWIRAHPAEAVGDLRSCRLCHGTDLLGRGAAVACTFCHPTTGDGEFRIHPESWGSNILLNHRGFPQELSWTACAACHGGDLRGGAAAPSCFLAGCHAEGPPPPHAIPYAPAQAHGAEAKNEQLYCRNCHGRPEIHFDGGFVTDPSILNKPTGNCSLCHPDALAHPTRWQGSNDLGEDYLSSHRTIEERAIATSCALCHNVSAPGPGPGFSAPSCFSAQHLNADGVTTGCHAGGPGSAPHETGQPWLLPSGHVAASIEDPQFCGACHTIGGVSPSCRDCHVQADPLQVGGCRSCHGNPPDNDIAPNREGSHGRSSHRDIINNCSNCHMGAGSGTLGHFDRLGDQGTIPNLPAEVNIDPAFDAGGQRAIYNPVSGNCSNVSCHGGVGNVEGPWYR